MHTRGRFRGLRQINQWEVALRFTLGKRSGRVEPGVTLYLPLFEKQAFDYYKEILAKDGLKDALEKAPSVILTDVEHKAITTELNAFWTEVRNNKPPIPIVEVTKRLRAKYEKVYKDHPHWLQSIQHLFKQIP